MEEKYPFSNFVRNENKEDIDFLYVRPTDFFDTSDNCSHLAYSSGSSRIPIPPIGSSRIRMHPDHEYYIYEKETYYTGTSERGQKENLGPSAMSKLNIFNAGYEEENANGNEELMDCCSFFSNGENQFPSVEEQKELEEMFQATNSEELLFGNEKEQLEEECELCYEEGQGCAQGEAKSENTKKRTRKYLTLKDFYNYHLLNSTDSLIFKGKELTEQYLIDAFMKVEGARLEWLSKNQNKIHARLYSSGNGDDDRDPCTKVLPSSHIGSPRAMIQLFHDAMAAIRLTGKPHFFITMTCNPKWPEITDNGSTPVIIARVFNMKLKELKKDLKNIFGKQSFCLHVIEFQKRGLPHAHIIMTLNKKDGLKNSEDIDDYISAELPDQEEDARLHELVRTHMMHNKCNIEGGRKFPCLNRKNKCSKNFPKELSPETKFEENGYPIYRRRQVDDQWVVPYNAFLLKKYDCHINVEAVSSVMAIRYLFKYVYKGYDKGEFNIANRDEIQSFKNFRSVCAPEAVWRLLGYPLYSCSHSIERLPVHLDFRSSEQVPDQAIREEEKKLKPTKLEMFFKESRAREQENLPPLLYSEMPIHYTWNKSSYKWTKRRRKPKDIVPRIYHVSPRQRERFFLRVLLLNVKGPLGFEELKLQTASFEEACKKLGLIKDDEIWIQTLEEAKDHLTPLQLREMFVFILQFGGLIGQPTQLWEKFKRELSADYILKFPQRHEETTTGLALCEILSKLQLNRGIDGVSAFNLPQPSRFIRDEYSEVLAEVDQVDANVIPDDIVNDRERIVSSFKDDQKLCYDKITRSIKEYHEQPENVQNRFFYIDGPAGSGKTFLQKGIIGFFCDLVEPADMQNFITGAFSGIAATLLVGGRTLHSIFRLPVPLNRDVEIKIPTETQEALRKAAFILLDEISQIPAYLLDKIDETLRNIMNNDSQPFGGKPVILMGDFRQTLPVDPLLTKTELGNNCCQNSMVWQHVTRLTLNSNKRVDPEEKEFADWVLGIGDGKESTPKIENCKSTEKELLDDLFLNVPPEEIPHNVVLTPLNEVALSLNEKILKEYIQGDVRTYKSIDYLEDSEGATNLGSSESRGIRNSELYDTEYLNTLTPTGMPPHVLNLKVGCIVMLVQNMIKEMNLVNGSRLKVTQLHQNFIEAEIINGPRAGKRVWFTKIEIKQAPSMKIPVHLCRIQFPLRLCYAMTINKSQGQTMNKVGIYLKDPVFGHGQLYVAVSRVRKKQNLSWFIDNDFVGKTQGEKYDEAGNLMKFTINIVNKSVLL